MIESYLRKKQKQVDTWLKKYLFSERAYPAIIHESMHYMVFNGGKRIRPILAIAAAEAVGGTAKDVAIPASAIEMIHTYSLIHDDLPCMDNDDERRGKPTCHKKYTESIAVLAGDALLTHAFEIMAAMPSSKIALRMIKELAAAAGTMGMIGGQVVDKLFENKEVTLPILDYTNVYKTGKLITVSCLLGALSARAKKKEEKALVTYGEQLGFAFQVVDDIIDGDGYCRFMSRHEAFKRAEDLITQAKQAVALFGKERRNLERIADFVLTRGRIS